MELRITRLDELPINQRVISLLRETGVSELFPPQEQAFNTGVLDGKNLVLAVPTSSGKTLVAEICMLKAILDGRGKAVYLVPLKSLAREKYDEFRKYEKLGISTALSVSDYDSPGAKLSDADIVVLTTERADSLVCHDPEWIHDIAVLIADEIHLVNDVSRGPTLEMVVAKLTRMIPDIQVIALSATIPNAEEIAGWLKAELVKSSWRPVPLSEGILFEGRIRFSNGSSKKVRRTRGEELADLICDTLDEKGQVLVFVSSRRSAVSVSSKIAAFVRPYLSREATDELSRVSDRIGGGPHAPESSKILAKILKAGIAFHHAGLANQERTTVEECFKRNLLKVIVATPTLAAGINLPARRVVVRDYRRFEEDRGNQPIPVLEYKQMAGRAGRPKYDEYGEAVLLARTEDEYDFLMDHYVSSEPEDIKSKLASESSIRFHLMTAIAGKAVSNRSEIDQLMEGTFFSFQFSGHEIDEHVSSALAFLEEGELIGSDERDHLYATALGEKAAKLYIDPLTAISFRKALSTITEVTPFGVLHLICSTPDEPLIRVAQSELEDYEAFVSAHEDELMVTPPDEWDDYESYSKFLAQVKTARMLNDWISERTERDITKDYDIGMGDIYRHVEAAEWLVYSASEVARVISAWRLVPSLQSLRARIRDGVLPELLELVSLRGIGRIRGRMLYSHDLKTLSDLYQAPLQQIARVPTIGSAIAESIKLQLSLEVAEDTKEHPVPTDTHIIADSAQTLLEDYEDEDS